MKLTLIALLIGSFSAQSFACALPLPTMVQQMSLERALASASYREALNEQVSRDYNVSIKSITFKNGVEVNLTNNCSINVTTEWKPAPQIGMCPQVKRVVAKTVCK